MTKSKITLPVLGMLKPDSMSEFLESDYWPFELEHVAGLARGSPEYLEILAIVSKRPGSGDVRALISELKKHYKRIRFWSMMNPQFTEALKRYGFVHGHDIDDDGIEQEVCDWNAWDAQP